MKHLQTRKFWIVVGVFLLSFIAISVYIYSKHHLQNSADLPKGYSGVAARSAHGKIPGSQDARAPAAIQQPSPEAAKKFNPIKDLKGLERRFRSKFQLDYSPAGLPFRLSGKLPLEKSPDESDFEAMGRLIHQLSTIMNINNPEQLKNPIAQKASLGTITNFQQTFEDLPVEGAQVRVHQDSNGQVFMVNSTYKPGVTNINTAYQVTPEEAIKLATEHALTLDPQQRVPTVFPASKVVYQFQKAPGTIESCWKVLVNQPWLGASHGSATYFINGHRADLNDTSTYDRIENGIQ